MRLIDADLIEPELRAYADQRSDMGEIELANGILNALYKIMEIPTIDPDDLRPHGKWIKIETTFDEEYAQCGEEFGVPDCCSFEEYVPNVNYCSNCGAKMDKE